MKHIFVGYAGLDKNQITELRTSLENIFGKANVYNQMSYEQFYVAIS